MDRAERTRCTLTMQRTKLAGKALRIRERAGSTFDESLGGIARRVTSVTIPEVMLQNKPFHTLVHPLACWCPNTVLQGSHQLDIEETNWGRGTNYATVSALHKQSHVPVCSESVASLAKKEGR
jgi:hypothetical protein